MSEETKIVEQTEQEAKASELSEQDLEKVAGGGTTKVPPPPPPPPPDCRCQPMPGKIW